MGQPWLTFFKKLSLVTSRNLLDCRCPTMLPLLQMSGWLNSPMRTRVCASEAFSSASKKASSTCSPWWDVCNTLPLWYPPYRPLPWPTGSPPAHYVSHWRAPCIKAAPSQESKALAPSSSLLVSPGEPIPVHHSHPRYSSWPTTSQLFQWHCS